MGTRQRSASLPSLSNISVAGSTVPFSPQVNLLGVTVDNSLSLNKHVASVSKSCFSTCAHYDTYVTPSLTMRQKPLPARSSGHDLTTLTPYWLAPHPKTSTGCTHPEHIGADCHESITRPNTQRAHQASTFNSALVASSASNRLKNCCSNLQTIVDWSAILSSM